jgi:hypothetical protein
MTRENQGLQIALIIFVTTTVALGATSWIFFQKNSETWKKLDAVTKENTNNQQEAEKAKNECKNLKELITGQPTADPYETIKEKFDTDMKTYGRTFPSEALYYRPLMEKLFQSLQEKNNELQLAEEKNQEQKQKFKDWESARLAQVKKIEEAQQKASADALALEDKLQKQDAAFSREMTALREEKDTLRKDKDAEIAQANEKADNTKKNLEKSLTTINRQGEKIESLQSTVVDHPDGEIRWVDQKNGLVWINLGRADALKPLQTFAVFPEDITDLTKGKSKASIEVTQLRGEHLAEARITRDEIADPILPGDKIFTPLWSPGEKIHFALAGLMDVDGDGRSDLDLVRHLIAVNDGVVDAYQEDQGNEKDFGKEVGKLSLGTRYLVLGEEPTEKTAPQFLKERSEMIDQAAELGLRSITLKDLLDRMGYRRQAHVVKYGPGANPQDFKARPESDVRRVSSGSVSEIFKPRQPPRGSSGGAY